MSIDMYDYYYSLDEEYENECNKELEYYEILANETKEHEKQILENEKEMQIYYELLKNGQFKSHHWHDDFDLLIA